MFNGTNETDQICSRGNTWGFQEALWVHESACLLKNSVNKVCLSFQGCKETPR